MNLLNDVTGLGGAAALGVAYYPDNNKAQQSIYNQAQSLRIMAGMQNSFHFYSPQELKLRKAKDFLKERAEFHPEWKINNG